LFLAGFLMAGCRGDGTGDTVPSPPRDHGGEELPSSERGQPACGEDSENRRVPTAEPPPGTDPSLVCNLRWKPSIWMEASLELLIERFSKLHEQS